MLYSKKKYTYKWVVNILTASQKYLQLTGKNCLYNIVAMDNIASIIANGILCYRDAQRHQHTSIALESVQLRREQVVIPGGSNLHQYTNLYFSYNNPMLYKRRDNAENLCILAVDVSVLDIAGCIVTDQNAAKEYVRFYSPIEGISAINFPLVFAKNWFYPDDEYRTAQHRAIKCAEVLIPRKVPYEYVTKACVVSEAAKNCLFANGFTKPIIVSPHAFFQR